MEMSVDLKSITTWLGILDITVVIYKIGQHVLKVVDDQIGPIIWYMNHKAINQNAEDYVLLCYGVA